MIAVRVCLVACSWLNAGAPTSATSNTDVGTQKKCLVSFAFVKTSFTKLVFGLTDEQFLKDM